MAMLPGDADRIDFISAYCDRWCERCAYTARCSAYACDVAAGMCGDFVQGLELALGSRGASDADAFADPGDEDEDDGLFETAEELAAIDRFVEDSHARVGASPITALAFDYTAGACSWLQAHQARLAAVADPVLAEALEIARYDATFVGAKLYRALSGKDQSRHEDGDEDRIQNDWNGSAKVALISLERSEAAWRTIAQATGDTVPSTLAARAGEVRRRVLDEFPDAPAFVRPGFDEPWR
jgi:hypothetical protein